VVRLWLEFLGFYLLLPLLLATALPVSALFPGLFVVTAIGLALLAITPGFHWGDLSSGVLRIDWRLVVSFTLLTAAVGYGVLRATAPAAFLVLPREMPLLMTMIAVLYPFLSALPQEIIFRPLFFRRYGALLPSDPRLQVGLNATIFAAAHLMYWSWVVAAMTFAGGLVFAWSYRMRGNFPEAVVLHSLAGIVIFTLGLGMFFYSGNIQRPF
jgi:membrane protease YdiL (CAAX protease family)